MAKYWYIWGGVFIIFGSFMAFGGNSFVKVVLFSVATIGAWVFLTWLTFYIFQATHVALAVWVDWVILGSCFLVALLVGWLVVKMRRLALALLGAAGGVAIGFLITTATLLHNGWAYYLILIAAGLVGALLTVWLAEWIIMIASAFFGSYLAVRGVSFYAGGFPSETSIVHMI